MLRTFNLGVGVTIVVDPKITNEVINHLFNNFDTYRIGKIIEGNKTVETYSKINW